MSMQDYETAQALMLQRPNRMLFEGLQTEILVQAAEKALGLIFPSTYRRFLLEYGSGSFGGEHIFGIRHERFEESGEGDSIWFTLHERETVEFPANYVGIYAVGNGEIFCLDIDIANNGEARVVAFNPGLPLNVQTNEVIAEDFGALLLQLVHLELDFIEEFGED